MALLIVIFCYQKLLKQARRVSLASRIALRIINQRNKVRLTGAMLTGLHRVFEFLKFLAEVGL